MALGSRFLALVQILLLVSWVKALDINYCSPDNTNTGFQLVQSFFQSNGACGDACRSEYAYAVIQGQNCWCSNYAPDYNVNTLRCSQPCPGYPSEWCGSPSSGLYAYFQLDIISPSGTSSRSSEQPSRTTGSSVSGPLTTESPSMFSFSGPLSSSPMTSQSEASSSVPPALTVITVQSTAPATLEQPTVTVTEQASRPSPSSSEPSSTAAEPDPTSAEETPSPRPTTLLTSSITSSPSPTQAASFVPSVITVTQNGTTITSTASSTPSADPALGQAAPTPSGGNAGKMAGIAIAAAVGLAAILALVFWIYTRRKNRNQSAPGTPDSDAAGVGRGLPKRHASQMSQAGLIDKNPRIVTTGLPAGSNGNSAGTSLSQTNRYSAGTDLRLNPSAIYINEASQHSSVSLQDNRDYSRQLQVRNPDS